MKDRANAVARTTLVQYAKSATMGDPGPAIVQTLRRRVCAPEVLTRCLHTAKQPHQSKAASAMKVTNG